MKKEFTISIVIPVHELTDITKKTLELALKSVEAQQVQPNELIIVAPKDSEVITYLNSLPESPLSTITKIIENDGNTDFASQINLGVKSATSDWVNILEFDDELANIWIKNVKQYATAYEDCDIYLPIVIDVNTNNEFQALANEVVWANSFSDELGILDHNALLAYQNFKTDGMAIKKSVFEELGGLKSNVKLMFMYEFLLRATFFSKKVMVIPKFGYKHINMRDGSLFHTYKQTIDPAEARWLLSMAKKEFYFKKDRDITYITTA